MLTTMMMYEEWMPLLYLAADWGHEPSRGDRRMFSMCIVLMEYIYCYACMSCISYRPVDH